MHTDRPHSLAKAALVFPGLLGFVAGTALQLQQASLFSWLIYGYFLLSALLLYALIAILNIAPYSRMGLAALALGLFAFGLTGLRASAFLS